LKERASVHESLAHLSQAEAEAVTLKDEALAKIREAQAAKEQTETGVKDKPVIKQTRVIKPEALSNKSYIETKEEADEFVQKLSKELDDALENGERIEIR
jgi:hypothetical protein